MPCKKCGTTQLIGYNGKDVNFCPMCKGVTVIDKVDSISSLGKEISTFKKKTEDIFAKYDRNEIIGRLTATREIQCDTKQKIAIDSQIILGANQALNYALRYNNFGSKDFSSANDPDFMKIWGYGVQVIGHVNLIRLIGAEHGVMIQIPEGQDITDYIAEKNISLIVSGETLESIRKKGGKQLFKFTETWKRYWDNYKKFGLYTETEIRQLESRKKIENKKRNFMMERTKTKFRKTKELPVKETKLSKLEKILSILNCFELGDLSGKQLRFDELKDNIGYNIGVIKLLSKWADDLFEEQSLTPIDERDLLYYLALFINPSDIPDFFSKFVSDESNVVSFPLVIRLDEKLLVPPNTLKLISTYLSYKHLSKDDIENLRSLEGYKFEEVIAKQLTSIGINVDYKNYMDNPKKPTFEIDIIAHYKSTILVIECKSWLLRKGFLFKTERYQREKDLKEQAEKQKKRVEYVKNNLVLLKYNKDEVTNIISIIITQLNKSIEIIDDSNILPVEKLEHLFDYCD